MLEETPDVMRLQADLFLTSQQDLGSEFIVVLLVISEEFPHLFTLDITIFLAGGVLEDFEETFTLVVIGLGLVSQLNEDINVRSSCRVHVMESALRHL